MQKTAIQAAGISKTFIVKEDRHNTVKHRLFHFFKSGNSKRIAAVKPLSIEILRGECIGLIGSNGSGKSTLVKLLSGIYTTDTGSVSISGTTLLMNLGVGMNHDLTARENVYISASILGLRIRQIDLLFQQIIDFAELNEFVDTKTKFFSSGMLARLAFSIAVNAGADIMFLDEIFTVGDIRFQEKAVKIFESSWITGKTVILVSHTMENIAKYCSKTAYMKNGRLAYFGSTDAAIDMYLTDNR